MPSQSNEVRTQATKRLLLAVVNQAISDVLENGKKAKEAEKGLLSADFDALDKLFAGPAEPTPICKTESAKRPILTNESNRRLRTRQPILDVESRFGKNRRPNRRSRIGMFRGAISGSLAS